MLPEVTKKLNKAITLLQSAASDLGQAAKELPVLDAHLWHGLTIFALACFVGYYVVWRVTPSLHTPLMSLTNAISSIIIIGGAAALSGQHFEFSHTLGFLAVFLASVNLFGGFVITYRMVCMFRKNK